MIQARLIITFVEAISATPPAALFYSLVKSPVCAYGIVSQPLLGCILNQTPVYGYDRAMTDVECPHPAPAYAGPVTQANYIDISNFK
jgi:hypothetical protein